MNTPPKRSILYRLPSTAWHFFRFLADRREPDRFRIMRGYLRIQFWLKAHPARTKPMQLLGFEVSYPSLTFLRDLYNEIFLEAPYRVQLETRTPRIIDAGAAIGFASLSYLLQFPEARIVAFEPDPENYRLFKQTIESSQLSQVELIQAALSDKEGTITLYYNDGEDRIPNSVLKTKHGSQKKVKALSLRPYLKEPVDVLKMDIEGGEPPVLRDCADLLKNVAQIQMEYHYNPDFSLSETLEILTKAGHEYHLEANRAEIANKVGNVVLIHSHRVAPAKKR